MNKLIEKFMMEKRWVNYRPEVVEERTTKIPYSPITKMKASSMKESDWATYIEASLVDKDHLGIVFTPDKKLLGIDIDKIMGDGKQAPEEVMEFFIQADTYCEISPSGTGLHFFLELTEPLDLIANRSGNYECYTSGRYFTVTENVYREEKDVRLVTPEEAIRLISILGYPWSKSPEPETTKEVTTELIDDQSILDKMFQAKNGIKLKALYEGDLTDYNNDESSADLALCSHLAFWSGRNHEQIERLWMASPLGNRGKTQKRKDYRDRTIKTAIKSCTDVYKKQSDDDTDYDFLCKIKGKSKTVTLCLENIVKILTKHEMFAGRFRFDNFKGEIEMLDNNKWIQFEDKHTLAVQRIISNMFMDFQTVKKDMVFDAILSVAHENAIDSAIDYLKGLKWDGVARLDTWLCSVYGVEDNEYHRAVGSNWMKGLVKRIVFPGSKYDQILVIEGKQGSKKSLSLYTLGFDGNWHIETTQSTESKDFFMQFSSKPIVEFAEGETLSRTEVKRMKAIITTQNDKFRAPYDRVSKDHPRRCVFAMTTNSSEYLKDETGNRRWLPITIVLDKANVEWLADNRDQLYAEAYHRVIIKNETTWEYPEEETKAQQDARRISDPNSELVMDWYFNAISEEDRNIGITILQVFLGAYNNNFGSKKMQKWEEMSIANILKDVLKLEKKVTHRNGIRCTRWYPKGVEVNENAVIKSVFEKQIAFKEF